MPPDASEWYRMGPECFRIAQNGMFYQEKWICLMFLLVCAGGVSVGSPSFIWPWGPWLRTWEVIGHCCFGIQLAREQFIFATEVLPAT